MYILNERNQKNPAEESEEFCKCENRELDPALVQGGVVLGSAAKQRWLITSVGNLV